MTGLFTKTIEKDEESTYTQELESKIIYILCHVSLT